MRGLFATAVATNRFGSRIRILRASRSPFVASFTRSLTPILMTRLSIETRSPASSPPSSACHSPSIFSNAAFRWAAVSSYISSMYSRPSHESSVSRSKLSICDAMNIASSAVRSESARLEANSEFSINSAAASLPCARSSLAICAAPRSFSKNSRRVSMTLRSASEVRCGFESSASISGGFCISSC